MLKGGDAHANAAALRAVLGGQRDAYRGVATFNAAAAIVVGGRARDLKDGMEIAARSIDSGEAARRLDLLIKISNA